MGGRWLLLEGKSWSISVGIESFLALWTVGEWVKRASVGGLALGGSGGSPLSSEVLTMVGVERSITS